MGYQIGNVCYATISDAENAYYSQVIPHIGADGKIYQMEHTQTGWRFEGLTVRAELPECDPSQNFKDGLEIGWGLFGIAAVIWIVQIVKRQMGI